MASNFQPIESVEDPYSILGVSKNVTQTEIKKAYYQKALMYHPDKNMNCTDDLKELSNVRIKELTFAYSLLINDRAKADELSEKSKEHDTSRYDGIRINNGYLTLNKRFSDKFRDIDDSSSNQYSLDKNLNLWNDEKFNDYKQIHETLESNINTLLKCVTCKKTFRSLRKKHQHQALFEHTRYLDPVYVSSLEKPYELLESSKFPLHVRIYHDDEWRRIWEKRQVFHSNTFLKANTFMKSLNSLNSSHELINTLNRELAVTKRFSEFYKSSSLPDSFLKGMQFNGRLTFFF